MVETVRRAPTDRGRLTNQIPYPQSLPRFSKQPARVIRVRRRPGAKQDPNQK